MENSMMATISALHLCLGFVAGMAFTVISTSETIHSLRNQLSKTVEYADTLAEENQILTDKNDQLERRTTAAIRLLMPCSLPAPSSPLERQGGPYDSEDTPLPE